MTGWEPDVLPGFVRRTLPAPPAPPAPTHRAVPTAPDPVVTLVRPATGPDRVHGTLVHLHGYNDYFFQVHLADAARRAGWDLLAVDARRAGRSLRPGDVPHLQHDLREQASDLALAVAHARADRPGLPVVVHAHSTGGLVAALWAHAARAGGGPDALVLDSPWLDGGTPLPRPLGDALVARLGRVRPELVLAQGPSHYAAAQHVDAGGRWEFDTTLKRPEGVPVRAAWLRAVLAGQRRVAVGLQIACDVHVLHSARSGPDRPGHPDLDRTDTVLDVRAIARRAPGLGERVHVHAVEGGVHDLLLSAPGPREEYLAHVVGVLDRVAVRAAAVTPG
ncbi:serine aminopeptidase domain-containing protein [Cellulomonas oligotrophica]|uniref:Alpha-beta hydrolase superfamily lysophospholipase n=1 Tax=Cellulomonas oligotrophica TaxID=931536 RepID=A0A7Y9JXG9_9CELL|nr:alpha/beta hydrolase [Cellulomonas oligotrophica]NYD84694.1 alpha-beta hydrolase superfamily lysophospholipase [Cellulomonas oligotrophica]GIG31761.1 alpha/beta hydrolase [Cellulomonas oligotrophica]